MARTNHDCEPKAATRIGCYLRIRTVVPLLLALCGFTVNAQEERRVDITLHDLGGIQSWLTAAAINDRGVIAGWASGPAFVLDTRTGAMVTLPYFEPRSINNRGE